MDNKRNSNENKYLIKFIDYIYVERQLSPNTKDAYKRDLCDYINYLNDKLKINDIRHVKMGDVVKYINHLNEMKLSTASIARHISCLKNFHRYLLKTGEIKNDPTLNIDTPKKGSHLPTTLSIKEIDYLLDIELKNHFTYRNKAMLELMYATGIRVSELVDLDINDINFEQCMVKLMGKGNKERIVPIGDVALEYLHEYIYNHRPFMLKGTLTNALFLNNHGKKISRQSFFLMINELAHDKGLNKYITPHVLRHSFASHMLEGGADLVSIQMLLGHSDIATTGIYTHVNVKKLKEEYDEFHPHSKGE